MGELLINLVTKRLLEKFGAGEHKPGSGSAAAFQGMLAAQLLITVIDLTNQPERTEKYKGNLTRLLHIKTDIQTRLYPSLELLFQEDSDLFDKVIDIRRQRDAIDKTTNWAAYREKEIESQKALQLATDLPIQIAQNCYELGEYAANVFDHGFQSARGDSGVALQGSIAGLASCLSVIELNLTKLPADEWMAKVRDQKAILKTQHVSLTTLATTRQTVLEKEANANWQIQQSFAKFRQGNLAKTIKSDAELEDLVRSLQNQLWSYKDLIWKKDTPTFPAQVIKPKDVVQKVLGYHYNEPETLGLHIIGDGLVEAAGVIDRNQQMISVSRQFPAETMNFTLAHELGHLILHEQAILHRDRPFDGSSTLRKDLIEHQADKFAAYFLMPRSIVKEVFEELFETPKLYINENIVLALRGDSLDNFKAKCKDIRGFANLIAGTKFYGPKSFNSLAQIFKVSVGTMAIRLIELDLVEF